MTIKLGNKLIGEENPCFIIAEAGVNHNGDMDLAKKLTDEAKKAGVDAVKFQTFKSEEIVTPYAEQAEYQKENIGKESQYTMLKRLELAYSDFRELKEYCDKREIIFLSTPHSCREDVDLIAELCPAIKVGSGDLTNLPILEYMAGKNLPVILSTGMSTLEEVREAVDTVLPINKDLILLHCTTNYPTPLSEVNLRAMLTMEKEFGLITGYSDHTLGIKVALAATALGAKVYEKHFTLDKNMPGPDHKASLDPKELQEMVKSIRDVEVRLASGEDSEKIIQGLDLGESLGSGIKEPFKSEIEIAKIARKSLVAEVGIAKGAVVSEEMLAIKRPGTGLHPRHFNDFVGKRAKKDIAKDALIQSEDFE